MSVITALMLWEPSPVDAEFHETWYGVPLEEPTEPPSTKYSTEAIGFASLAVTPSVTLPETTAPVSGELTEPVGAVLSTIFDAKSVMLSFAGIAVSRAMKRKSHEPSSAGVVAHVALYGAVVSTPIDVHVESLESLRWNSTSARSAPPGPFVGFALSVTVPRR